MNDFIDFFTATHRLGDGKRVPLRWTPFFMVWITFLIVPFSAFHFASTDGNNAFYLKLLNGILMFVFLVVIWTPISVIMSRVAITAKKKKEESINKLLHEFLDDLCSKEEVEQFSNQITSYLTHREFRTPVVIKLNYDKESTKDDIEDEIGYYAYKIATELNKNGKIVNIGGKTDKKDGCGSFFFQTFRNNFQGVYEESTFTKNLKERYERHSKRMELAKKTVPKL